MCFYINRSLPIRGLVITVQDANASTRFLQWTIKGIITMSSFLKYWASLSAMDRLIWWRRSQLLVLLQTNLTSNRTPSICHTRCNCNLILNLQFVGARSMERVLQPSSLFPLVRFIQWSKCILTRSTMIRRISKRNVSFVIGLTENIVQVIFMPACPFFSLSLSLSLFNGYSIDCFYEL